MCLRSCSRATRSYGLLKCRRHKKRKQEEMQFIKGNKKHHGGYSSGGGLTSKGPIVDGKALFGCTVGIASTGTCLLRVLFT